MATAKAPRGTTALVSVAAFIVLTFGLQAAQAILVPLLFSIFLAVICAPPMRWLETKKVPSGVALLLVVLVAVTGLVVTAVLVDSSIGDFSQRLPFYEKRLDEEIAVLGQTLGFSTTLADLTGKVQMGAAMSLAAGMFDGLSAAFGNVFLIVFTVIFILLESSSFPVKLRRVLVDSQDALRYFSRFAENVQHYLAIKTVISLVTGVTVWGWTAFMGVDFPVLWGMLAFLLNFVPNIGSILAAVPAVILALIQFGPTTAGIVASGYIVINMAVGNVVEPRVMGRGLGLSTLVVFLSLVFWGWVFGPVGMLLSVPLTMTAKIALESSEGTTWIASLLGTVNAEEVDDNPTEHEALEASAGAV